MVYLCLLTVGHTATIKQLIPQSRYESPLLFCDSLGGYCSHNRVLKILPDLLVHARFRLLEMDVTLSIAHSEMKFAQSCINSARSSM